MRPKSEKAVSGRTRSSGDQKPQTSSRIRLHRPSAGRMSKKSRKVAAKRMATPNRSRARGKRDPCASAIDAYSQVASAATSAAATTTIRKDPFRMSSSTSGMRTAAGMTRFMTSRPYTAAHSPAEFRGIADLILPAANAAYLELAKRMHLLLATLDKDLSMAARGEGVVVVGQN